jgi:hypothetical protein
VKGRLSFFIFFHIVGILNASCISDHSGVITEESLAFVNTQTVKEYQIPSPSMGLSQTTDLPATNTNVEIVETALISPTANSSISTKVPTLSQLTDLIGSINADPEVFEGQTVEIIGFFRGWDLENDVNAGPPVSRSDWVITDNTGGIYVHSKIRSDQLSGLDPSSLVDSKVMLHLFGNVLISEKGLPYLELIDVMIVGHSSPLIGSIVSNVDEFNLVEVEVIGFFHGWDLLNEIASGPPVTRSDWVVSDASGAIYISAKSDGNSDFQLDPSDPNSINVLVRVKGIVQKNSSKQPFITPISFDVLAQ